MDKKIFVAPTLIYIKKPIDMTEIDAKKIDLYQRAKVIKLWYTQYKNNGIYPK